LSDPSPACSFLTMPSKLPPRPGFEVHKNNDGEIVIAQLEDPPLDEEDALHSFVHLHPDDVPTLIAMLKNEMDEDQAPEPPRPRLSPVS
jgi:hypothetical protein